MTEKETSYIYPTPEVPTTYPIERSVTERLREGLAEKAVNRWPDGSVLSWKVNLPFGQGVQPYTFVALYVAGTERWYLTGRGPNSPGARINGEEIVEYLFANAAYDIRVATAWEDVQ